MQTDFGKKIFSELRKKDLHEIRQELEKSCRHYLNFPTILLENFIDTKELLQLLVSILFLLGYSYILMILYVL
jgi:hypothetical protein